MSLIHFIFVTTASAVSPVRWRSRHFSRCAGIAPRPTRAGRYVGPHARRSQPPVVSGPGTSHRPVGVDNRTSRRTPTETAATRKKPGGTRPLNGRSCLRSSRSRGLIRLFGPPSPPCAVSPPDLDEGAPGWSVPGIACPRIARPKDPYPHSTSLLRGCHTSIASARVTAPRRSWPTSRAP